MHSGMGTLPVGEQSRKLTVHKAGDFSLLVDELCTPGRWVSRVLLQGVLSRGKGPSCLQASCGVAARWALQEHPCFFGVAWCHLFCQRGMELAGRKGVMLLLHAAGCRNRSGGCNSPGSGALPAVQCPNSLRLGGALSGWKCLTGLWMSLHDKLVTGCGTAFFYDVS